MSEPCNTNISEVMFELHPLIERISEKKLTLAAAGLGKDRMEYALLLNSIKYEEFINLADKEKLEITAYVEKIINTINHFLGSVKDNYKNDRIYHKDIFLDDQFLINNNDGKIKKIYFERVAIN